MVVYSVHCDELVCILLTCILLITNDLQVAESGTAQRRRCSSAHRAVRATLSVQAPQLCTTKIGGHSNQGQMGTKAGAIHIPAGL